MDRPAEFDRDAAERILRRAVQLSDDTSSAGVVDDGISPRALIEAADELGIEAVVVRQAVSEERLGLLAERPRAADRLVGPPAVRVSRLVDGSPEDLLDRADAWLRHIGGLRRQRRGPGGAEYLRRSDLAAGVQRTVRLFAGEEDLRRVKRLTVTVQPVDGERSVVALVADLRVERALTLAGGSGVAGFGSLISVGSVVEGFMAAPWLLLSVPASAAAGAGILVARTVRLTDVETALAGVLDRIELRDSPVGVLSEVRRRVVATTTARLRGSMQRPPRGAAPGPS